MKTVCVVTLYRHNYGAFLQAYASQRFLEQLGYDAIVLNYDYMKDNTVLGISIKKIRKPVSFAKTILYRLTRLSVAKEKDRILSNSADQKIKQTSYYKHYTELCKTPPNYDVFIVGSDQVWNPEISEQGFPSRLLGFVPDNSKSVLCSFAASVGTDHFSENDQEMFRKNLKRFDAISLREESSVSLIKQVTDKDIAIHKDPALLLDDKQWSEFATDPYPGKKYVFLYLAQKSPELVGFAEKIAKAHDWGLVDCHASVNYELNGTLNGKKILSPMEFVGGIKNAAYVVTNSFHCLVFSIHFQKKAMVNLPPKSASRLMELIENMKLHRLMEEKEIYDGEEVEIYRNTFDYLKNERFKAKKYLSGLADISAKK
jgi:hypothetical protein